MNAHKAKIQGKEPGLALLNSLYGEIGKTGHLPHKLACNGILACAPAWKGRRPPPGYYSGPRQDIPVAPPRYHIETLGTKP